uniref:Uncharacterized protein n=1 Tax=Oryza glaberrima TaxID=4538 RepID=I1Q3E7_ORYGL
MEVWSLTAGGADEGKEAEEAVEGERGGKLYSTLTKAPCLYGSTPRSTKASTTNVDKALSQTLRLLDRSRTVPGSRQGMRNEEMVYPPR